MKSNKSSQKFSSLISVTVIALCLAACGGEQSLKGDNGSAQASKAESVRSTANGNSGLALQLPASMPQEVDTVVVNLVSDACIASLYDSKEKRSKFGSKPQSQKVGTDKPGVSVGKEKDLFPEDAPGDGVFCGLTQDFPLKDPSSAKDGSIALDNLDPGHYSISIDLINGKTGKVYERGDGTVQIQTGKTAKAEISMSHVVEKTGGLQIVLK